MDPASWAAAVAAMEAMAAETAAALGTAAAGTAAVAPEAMLATAPAAASAFGALAPGTELAASMMLPAEALPFITEMAPLAGEASIGFSAPGMAGMEAMMAPMTMTTSFPWEQAGKAAMKGLAMGQPPEQPMSSGGGRPPSGRQAQAIPTFDYGAPTVQIPSMSELMRKREEMMRRRRGY